ncbi:MAG: hypothetical protein H7175_09265 [Burkholderiales bacterium]|nr:hypothetical protein [Anaerolineae bacterium]
MASFDMGDGGAQPNREELLKLGIRSAKAGNSEPARMMFRRVLAEDSRNERALMWMANLAETRTERIQWLNQVLEINPDNTTAKDTLRKMAYKKSQKQNRVLLVFGVVVVVLFVLGIAVVVLVLTGSS